MKRAFWRITALLLFAALIASPALLQQPAPLSASNNAQIFQTLPAALGTLAFSPVQPLATPTRTPTPINLGNFVWDDLDSDGRQDAGEPGLAGVTVQLWNNAKTQLLDSEVTSASGNYTVIAPIPGAYRIRVILPSGLDTFSPKDLAGGDDTDDSDINPDGANAGYTDTINIANNVISMTSLDAGIRRYRTPTPTRTPTPINLGNFVWDDLDSDGRQDAGEPGLAGIHVQLWNPEFTIQYDSEFTNANGNYTVIAPIPGAYRIRVILPNGLDTFSPKDLAGGDDTDDSDINPDGNFAGFTDVINIANNVISMTSLDAGIRRYRTPTPTRTPTPINLGNFVWRDLDSDGRQDANEPGISGITVQLWNAAKTQLIDDAVTNANGNYTVVAPLPGSYRIRVVLPNNSAQFTGKDLAGGDDTDDSDINPSGANAGFTDIINIANNVISMTSLDAGIRPQVTIVVPVATISFLTQLPIAQPLATATPFSQPLPPINAVNCTAFRLTSPLDGLPNGVATFYWDPAGGQNLTYQIRVFDEARNLLASFPAGASTNVNGDVSQSVIGGGFVLIVQANALQNGAVVCTDERRILRSAPNIGQPPIQPQPTPTPTRRRGN